MAKFSSRLFLSVRSRSKQKVRKTSRYKWISESTLPPTKRFSKETSLRNLGSSLVPIKTERYNLCGVVHTVRRLQKQSDKERRNNTVVSHFVQEDVGTGRVRRKFQRLIQYRRIREPINSKRSLWYPDYKHIHKVYIKL